MTPIVHLDEMVRAARLRIAERRAQGEAINEDGAPIYVSAESPSQPVPQPPTPAPQPPPPGA